MTFCDLMSPCIHLVRHLFKKKHYCEIHLLSITDGTKCDLAINKVKVNAGSLFEQTLQSLSPQCYFQSFKVIHLKVLEKEIFKGFLP